MANKRIYYAVEAIGLSTLGSTTYTPVHGVQSVGLNLNFSVEDILELGQLEVYEIKEDIPEVEVTIEKVLDGYPLAYHLATRGAPSPTLAGRQNQRCSMAISAFGDTQESASGVPVKEIIASGLYWSSVSYSFPADGNFTESITLVGNNLQAKTAGFNFQGTIFDNTDQPLALVSGLGGVQRRQEFLWGTDGSIIPQDVEGISASGFNLLDGEGQYGAHVSNINVSVDFGRDQIVELGRKAPYFRYGQLPTEVTTEIEIISTAMHSVNALEDADNLINRTILLKVKEGTTIDLGSKNKLTSVTKGGGNVDGSNETISYSYRTLNNFTVTHPQDPMV